MTLDFLISHPHLVVASHFLVLVLIAYWRKSTRNVLQPPGPKGYPLLGNIFDLPRVKAWITYANWEHLYKGKWSYAHLTHESNMFLGGIIYASVLGQHILIINDREIAIELLERRAHIYSDRPHIPMLELFESLWLSLTAPRLMVHCS